MNDWPTSAVLVLYFAWAVCLSLAAFIVETHTENVKLRRKVELLRAALRRMRNPDER